MANRRGFCWDTATESWTRLPDDGIPCGICGLCDCICERTLGDLLPLLRPLEQPPPELSDSESLTEAGDDPYLVPEQLCCN